MDQAPQFLDVGGRRIAYRHEAPANAPAIIIWLPGFMSDMDSTKATHVADWARGREIATLRFDYSGHGLSSGNIAQGAIGDWLEEADAIVRLSRGPLILAGSSMGGWIGLLLLRRMAERGDPPPLGCVLVAPAWDMTEALMWDKATAEQRAALLRDGIFYQPSDYSDDPYPIGRRLIDEGRAHLLEGQPFDPRCPVRILQGMRDADVPWERALRLTELLTGDEVTLTLVKDSDHRLSRDQDLARLTGEIELLVTNQN